MEDRCGCVSCSDDTDEDRTSNCNNCGHGTMTNRRVVCYNGNSNGIPQDWVTEDGTPWTSNHGWSQCEDCQNMGSYI